jgi:acyl-CoA thioester hydrolase
MNTTGGKMSEKTRPEALADYHAVVTFPMHWGEMDAFGHLNNVIFFRYFESARIAFFESVKFTAKGLPGGVGPILAFTSCRFKAPMTFPDSVSVGSRVVKIEDDRFTIEHAIFSEKLGLIAAVGDAVIVAYNYDTLGKAPLPDEWRALLAEKM